MYVSTLGGSSSSKFVVSSMQMNELSRNVLRSIEVGLVASRDDGNCLKRVLCENNQLQSSEHRAGSRIWMPIWRYISQLKRMQRKFIGEQDT